MSMPMPDVARSGWCANLAKGARYAGMVRRILLLAAVVSIGSDRVFAGDAVPVLDVKPTCRAVASRGLGNLTTVERCVEQETSAHNDLAQRWWTFELADRRQCIAQTSTGGIPSYVELLTCITIAADARALERRDAAQRKLPSTQGMGGR